MCEFLEECGQADEFCRQYKDKFYQKPDCLRPVEASESPAPSGPTEFAGCATDLAEAQKENAKLRKIIKEVWDMYENPSQVWWDSGLLMELQEIAEQ